MRQQTLQAITEANNECEQNRVAVGGANQALGNYASSLKQPASCQKERQRGDSPSTRCPPRRTTRCTRGTTAIRTQHNAARRGQFRSGSKMASELGAGGRAHHDTTKATSNKERWGTTAQARKESKAANGMTPCLNDDEAGESAGQRGEEVDARSGRRHAERLSALRTRQQKQRNETTRTAQDGTPQQMMQCSARDRL